MANRADSLDATEPSREVRLGIVMYGGVSLAIYIYGVAREFFHATQGDDVYGLVGAITDSDVTVDVISGTSAGGINGILLAYALCNGYDFAEVAKLWSEAGDIADLLRTPGSNLDDCVSVLDSEGKYLPKLRAAFANMATQSGAPRRTARIPQELDLFVTGTRVHGNIYTVFDDAGHAIDVKDYRTVFWLKHRLGRKHPFDPGFREAVSSQVVHGSLARLAAITSCFPAAFSPMHVADSSDQATEDGRLQKWGDIGGEAYFLDGGILDNKPFTPTLKAIFSRVANREVERRLFYVEPDPERFTRTIAIEQPNAPQAAVAALLGIPGYESIAEDLRLLTEHNSKVEQYALLLAEVQPRNGHGRRAANAEAGDHRVPPPTNTGARIYARTRLVALVNRVIRGVLWEGAAQGTFGDDDRKLARHLMHTFDYLVWPQANDNGVPPFVNRLLDEFDAYARLRRVVRVIYQVYGRLFPLQSQVAGDPTAPAEVELTPEQRQSYHRVLEAFNRQLKIYEIIIAFMEEMVDGTPFAWRQMEPKQLWDQVLRLFTQLLGTESVLQAIAQNRAGLGTEPPELLEWGGWLPRHLLTQIRNDLAERVVELRGQLAEGTLPSEPIRRSILQDLEGYEREILRIIPNRDDCVRVAYDEFYDIDARIYPLELVADIKEKDIVRTIRVSPWDAQRGFSRRDGADKLAGDSVHHFGGFFKRSWRSNDVLWGRLDGLCQLVECLLTRDRVQRLGRHAAFRARIRDRLKAPGLDPAKLFARSGEATHETLRDWLRDLFAEEDGVRSKACEASRFAEMRDLLIEAAQLEILGVEVPEVINDAITEQGSWNSYRAARTEGTKTEYDVEAWQFHSPDGVVDPMVAMSAAAHATRNWINGSANTSAAGNGVAPASAAGPKQTPLGSFFLHKYKVGSEEVQRHIPTVVLLGILSKALLAVRNSVLNSLGAERRARVRSSLAYRILIDGPLHAFDLLVGVSRSAPGSRNAIRVALIVAPILLVVAGVATNFSTIASGLFAILVWVLAPLALLRLVVEVFLRSEERPEARLLSILGSLPWWVFALLAAATVALAIPASGSFQFLGDEIPKVRDLALGGTVDAANAVLGKWDARLTAAARSAVIWDFALIPAYALTLIVAIARWLPRVGRLASIAAVAALLVGVLDVVENVALLRMLDGNVTTGWAMLSAGCAWPKFTLAAGLLVLLAGAKASRRKEVSVPKPAAPLASEKPQRRDPSAQPSYAEKNSQTASVASNSPAGSVAPPGHM